MNKSILRVGVIVSIFLLLGSNQAFAVEKITGAFGMELGRKFEPSSATEEIQLEGDSILYQFKPENTFRSFSIYAVQVTPKTHLVHTIWGIGKMENTDICKNEQAVLMSILESKYGPQIEKGLQALQLSLNEVKMIAQEKNSRVVLTKCEGFMDVDVYIRAVYTDNKLTEQAEKERIALETKKVDSSGL